MTNLFFPYGKKKLPLTIEDGELSAVLTSSLGSYVPEGTEEGLVEEALKHPIDSPSLAELSAGKKHIVLIASDHTRPVPSKLIVPPMLREIRKGNPDAQITILIATGCHRGTTNAELIDKFGEEIVINERIVVHDCDDEANLVSLGILPSGAELRVNRLAAEADLVVAEGFIEPHFFAGFSGGRKSVLPGICARKTVMENHCSAFIADPKARTGILDGNPIHRDMVRAAELCKLAFIVNVVLDENHKVIYAVAGNAVTAHRRGCDFLKGKAMAAAAPSDIVISTNGGYPLDQNIYQSVKGMTAAEATVKEGGVIIMLSASSDGHGGATFYETFRDEKDLARMEQTFLARPAGETIPDQWQSQIFCRVLQKARVIFVSEAPDVTVRDLHMIPAHSLGEALALAKELIGSEKPSICAIPDGIGVIVCEAEKGKNRMEITKELSEKCLTVKLSGRLDTMTAPLLEEELGASFDSISSLVLDFTELTYISSAGLRVLLMAQKIMGSKEGMEVTGVSEDILNVLEMTGFSDILTIR